MNNKCTKCGSANVVEGKLSTGTGGLVFTTQNQILKKAPLPMKIIPLQSCLHKQFYFANAPP